MAKLGVGERKRMSVAIRGGQRGRGPLGSARLDEGADRWARRILRLWMATPAALAAAIVGLGMLGAWGAGLLAGGADHLVPHAFYLPILFAAARFGGIAALAVGLLSGLLAGPLADPTSLAATSQETARWLTRTGFFVGLGQLMAWLVFPSLPSIADELRRLREERELWRGLQADELFVCYQPIVALDRGEVVGVEALVRWCHPERGNLSPAAFLDTAEQSEIIHELGRFVLDEACRQAVDWRRRGQAVADDWFVSVNLSARELEAEGLAQRVSASLETSGLAARHLCVEITESVLVEEGPAAAQQLQRLKELGVRIAVDDFGTGYSSLSYLARFPLDVVKLDRSFVAALGSEPGAEAMAGGVLQLCHALDLLVIAEGIEVHQQAEALRELSYDLAQGYHYARPMAPEALAELLTAGSAMPGGGRA